MYRSRRNDGPPAWLVFLLGVAFVFGGYYLWIGFRSYVDSGGLSADQAALLSAQDVTATIVREQRLEAALPTARPTSTPRPACQDFEVNVASGIMRSDANTNSRLVTSLPQGSVVCVLEQTQGADGATWYLIDRDSLTRRIEAGYMRGDIVRPLNPTPTPSNTPLPPPTITATYTLTPTVTSTATATPTPD